MEDNLGLILFVMLFVILSITACDLVTETVRASVITLLYKFKYLYLHSFLIIYQSWLGFVSTAPKPRKPTWRFLVHRSLFLVVGLSLETLSALFMRDLSVITILHKSTRVPSVFVNSVVTLSPISICLLCHR